LLPNLTPGGAERLHLNLANDWVSRGFRVEFVLQEKRGQLLSSLPTGMAVDLKVTRARSLLPPLIRYLKSRQPDALLAAMWPLTVIAPVAARIAGFSGRVVVSEHAPQSLAYKHRGSLHDIVMRSSMALGYRQADACVGVSAGVVNDMATLSGLPRTRFAVIHNPAALGAAVGSPRPLPKALQGVVGPLILSVGTLKAVKRHDLLIDAFARLPVALGATLCILGEGQERATLERQILANGLSGRVLLPGFADKTAPWYAHAALFVLSSDYEGFGNVIVEAMEQGIPVVSTDCPYGPREILDGGRYGTLVPVGDVAALAEAMQDALLCEHNTEELRCRARDFSVDRAADAYLDVLFPQWRNRASA
jgi:glycosyltransferase involved in cell wall biosynthesis